MRLRSFIAVFALLCGVLPLTARADIPPRREADTTSALWHYTEGIKRRFIHNDTLGAMHLYERALERDSAFAPAHYELSQLLVDSDGKEAVSHARAAYRIDSTNRWFLKTLVHALVSTGSIDRPDRRGEVLGLYRKLVAEEKSPDNYRLLSLLYERAGQPVEAIATLDSAAMLFGRIPYLERQKIRILLNTNRLDDALRASEQQVEADPSDPEALLLLAELNGMSGRDSVARVHYRRALELDRTNLQVLAAYSDFALNRRDYDTYFDLLTQIFYRRELPLEEKLRIFRQLTADRKFYGERYTQLSGLADALVLTHAEDRRVVDLYREHLLAGGRFEQLGTFFKRKLDEEKPLLEDFMLVIELEDFLKRPDSVQHYLQRAIDRFPEEFSLRLLRGHVLTMNGRAGEGIEAYYDALPHASTDSLRSAVYASIGDAWQELARGEQKVEQAVERQDEQWKTYSPRCYDAYRMALKYNPDNVPVLNNFAYYLSLEGRQLKRAVKMSARAVELQPSNPTYIDTHAWVLYRLGRLEEAKKLMQQALSLDGQRSAELQMHYGDILAALGETFMAETYWKRALANGYDKEAVERRLKALNK